HLVSTLVLRRSILTEKVARRGYHVMREYAVDPLEALFVREVMRDDLRVVRPEEPAVEARDALERDRDARRQRLYPVVGDDGRMLGVVGWSHLAGAEDETPVSLVMHEEPLVAFDD